jgi:hypothetical protein
MEMTDSEWAAHRGRTTTASTTGSKPAGLLERLKGGVSSRINEQKADFNQRINDPKGWREKQHNLKLESDSRRVKELTLESKLARLEASKARSQASARKYAPAPSGNYDAPLFDMGGGSGGGSLFDLGGGFDSDLKGGRKGEVPLFDFGMGGPSKPKKHKKNKKSKKNNGSGIHIHINK